MRLFNRWTAQRLQEMECIVLSCHVHWYLVVRPLVGILYTQSLVRHCSMAKFFCQPLYLNPGPPVPLSATLKSVLSHQIVVTRDGVSKNWFKERLWCVKISAPDNLINCRRIFVCLYLMCLLQCFPTFLKWQAISL